MTFDAYAAYYDELYVEKDYEGDVEFILPYLWGRTSILDLGCGTGRHGMALNEKGFSVFGVDQSAEMIERAKQRILCECCDIRKFMSNMRFDAVVSLFHVASYMTTNDDMHDFLSTARYHLAPGGVFIFDFWYGPAVLAQRPVVTVRETPSFIRIATPTLDTITNTVTVDYKIKIVPWAGGMNEIRETHKLRYWFIPELVDLLDAHNFDVEKYGPWRLELGLTEHDWNGYIIARRRA